MQIAEHQPTNTLHTSTGGPTRSSCDGYDGLWRGRSKYDLDSYVAADVVLGPGENEGLLGDALRDGRAVYASADVCNLDQLIKAFEGVDVVFHTAAADSSKNNLQLHYKVNTEGTKNVIDACMICKVKRLIYTSSIAVVFDGVHGLLNVNESLPYPDKFPDAYAQTKAEAEKLVMKANGINDLLTCCIRPATIFGPGDIVIPTLDLCGKTHFIFGDGKNRDDFVYVENVVHGHICADKTLSTVEGAKTSGGKAYFITNMEPMNMWDFLYMLHEELGYNRLVKIRVPLVIIKPVSYLVEWAYNVLLHHYGFCPPQVLTPTRIKYLTLHRTFSCNKAVEELGYKPIVTLMVLNYNSSGVTFISHFPRLYSSFLRMLIYVSKILPRMV